MIRLHSLCILQGAGAAEDIFFKGKIFYNPPAPTHHTEFLRTPLMTKRKNSTNPPPPPFPRHSVLTRKVKYRPYDEMVKR